MAQVELFHVAKKYENGFEAVSEVTLFIERGEFVVLVGPSGCGKTTTLRMVAGLESISSGELRMGGRRVNEVPPRERDVAMVFQSYALYPHMTVRENMAFGLTLRKIPAAEIKQRVEAAAESLGLTEFLDRKPKEMSGGQRQRVAMGRAIVRRAGVFLFDEPLSNLDAKLRGQMRIEVSRLHRAMGATSLYVTHDQVEAMTLADRIVLMRGGKVQQVGPPLELYDRPVNLFVATFLGSPAMNILSAERQGDAAVGDGFRVPLPEGLATPRGALRLGVRPQHVRVVDGLPGPDAIPAAIDVVEPLGAETHLICTVGGQTVTARVDGAAPFRAGETIGLRFDPAGLHVFDPETEARCE
jgi:multiple sugar transport system ATP-binding protein